MVYLINPKQPWFLQSLNPGEEGETERGLGEVCQISGPEKEEKQKEV